jgi:hypothetical protein
MSIANQYIFPGAQDPVADALSLPPETRGAPARARDDSALRRLPLEEQLILKLMQEENLSLDEISRLS